MSLTSDNAYKVKTETDMDRDEQLVRLAKSLLNKICPENVKIIATRIKDEGKVASEEESRLVIVSIFEKALLEMHYSETYADLVFFLKDGMPEFESKKGGKPVTFKSTLLNVLQDEYNRLPDSVEATEEEDTKHKGDKEALKILRKRKKDRFIALMRFIGHMYLRKLLQEKVIGEILKELLQKKAVPDEHVIECVCELLLSIGYTLEHSNLGGPYVAFVCGRLKDLKTQKVNKQGVFSKRIEFVIQDVLDVRAAKWEQKKVNKPQAKTLEEVAKEFEQLASGKKVEDAERSIAGARPAYLDAQARESTKAEPGWTDAPKGKTRR